MMVSKFWDKWEAYIIRWAPLCIPLYVIASFTGVDIYAGLYPVFKVVITTIGTLGLAFALPGINIKMDISYEMYLLHMIFVNVMISMGIMGVSGMVFAICLTVIFCQQNLKHAPIFERTESIVMKKCLNIIVYYDNEEEVREYVSRLCELAGKLVDIIIVINKDTENKAISLFQKIRLKGITNVKIVNYNCNVGYMNAMLNTVKDEEINKYKYVILSNTDIEYITSDFFERLLNNNYEDDVGCIAPSVYVPEKGYYSNPHYITRIPKKKLVRLKIIFSFPFFARIYLKIASIKAIIKKKSEMDSCYVYSPHGCYMIFSAKFINLIKSYTYGVKLYSEESYVGELLIQKKMKCFYDSSLKISHRESTVTGKMDYKKKFGRWKKSIDYILEFFY